MKQVTNQTIDGLPMAEYIANLAVQLDNAEVDKERMQIKLQVMKQLNNHHKNIIDALRVEAKIKYESSQYQATKNQQ
jgi:hypothetical protein